MKLKSRLWVIPFSNGNTSVGIVGPTDYIDKLSENGNTAEALRKAISLSDYYVKRFGNVEFLFEPKHLKDYSCSVKKLFGDGFALTEMLQNFLILFFHQEWHSQQNPECLAAKLAIRQLNGEKIDWQKEYSDYILYGVNVFTTYVKEWYTGNLQELFFHQPENPDVKRKICAVLAGYVGTRKILL